MLHDHLMSAFVNFKQAVTKEFFKFELEMA